MTFKQNLSAVLLITLPLLGTSAFAQDAAIPFISINMIADGQNEVFEDYTEHLTPIIEAHNSDFTPMDVTFDVAGQLSGSMVVTFGQFGSSEDASAFNQDPAFLELFPMLESSLADHMVFFPDGPTPELEELSRQGSYLMTFVWSDTSTEELHAYNDMINGVLEPVLLRHGGTNIGSWQATAASRGLGEDLVAMDAPQLMELWHFDDLRGFFEDPESADAPQPAFEITRRYFLQLVAP